VCGEPRKRLTSHAVESGSFELRNGKTEPSRCQRLHEVLLGDRCAQKGVCLTRLGKLQKALE
jgi:hypothetical protein